MSDRLEQRKASARWTGRYIVCAFLETIGLALMLCVPLELLILPPVLDLSGYRFNPFVYAFWLVAIGLPTWALGLVLRPRILRPDFVNSILLYQEDQT
ncbi:MULTISPECIES: hypothetical protein [Thiomonas]|uniref:hypothetical protein n=1 Tax=Thiomonas TaxID=32012 RepID=UPI0004DBB9C6|nr:MULTISPECIES: hypothetical protein [Thiomonas]OYV41026.1 MAG: hypothetical protein B7Z83_00315 [Thiomonas sp. 20-64-5]OZB55514.1 MAG: hypothetical protein B7X43_00820 [Thiomonas sp. 15-63-373]CQR42459.1 conserved hypothetical protein [Thiomonas sp. CB3]MBN8777237.1 hypothetical protein [Thiomonas arsenitoxydans]CDW96351.1 conserved hypothetical protein [Thiomonas sp. CB2]